MVSFLQNDDPTRHGDRSIYDYVRGNYLDPRSCKVSWDWKEPQEVGQTMSFRVQVTNHKLFSQTFFFNLFEVCTDYTLGTSCSSIKITAVLCISYFEIFLAALLQKWPAISCT